MLERGSKGLFKSKSDGQQVGRRIREGKAEGHRGVCSISLGSGKGTNHGKTALP